MKTFFGRNNFELINNVNLGAESVHQFSETKLKLCETNI